MSKNVITLRSWASKMKEYHFQPCRQKNGARLPFVKPVKYDSMGNAEMILSPEEMNDPNRDYFLAEDEDIVVVDGTTFDLDDPLQRNKWEAIKNSDLIVPTRDFKFANGDYAIDGNKRRYGIAELWIDIPGQDSERSVSKKKQITKAWTFIEKDSKQGRLTRCKLLGKYMENAPDADVEEYLYSEAMKHPEVVLELYTGSDMALKLLLIDAKQKGIIIKNSGMYTYGEAILGATDDAVLIFFKNPANKSVVDQITFETYPDYAPVEKLEEKIKNTDASVEQTPAKVEKKTKK